MEGKIIHSC